ncbi:MAG: RING finger protein [bacterium]|nr:RING finger protein [bacterium]
MRCRQCRRKISKYAKECPYCKEKIKTDKNAVMRYMNMIQQMQEEKQKKKSRRVQFILCTISLLLLVLMVSGSSYLKYKNRWEITGDTLLYIKNDSLIAKDLDRKEEKVVTDELSGGCEQEIIMDAEVKVLFNNEKEQTLYFAENIKDEPLMSYSIYEQNTENWKEPPKKIAEHVRLCTRDTNEVLYYVTYDDAYLYKYNNGTTEQLLLPYISQLQYVKEYNRLVVICKKENEDGVNKDGSYKQRLDETWQNSDTTINSLYHVIVDTFESKCVVKDLGAQYKVSDSFKYVYYLQDNRLYECKAENEEVVTFKTNVNAFTLATIDKKEILYYIQYELKHKTYYEFVKDPYQAADDQVEETPVLRQKETKEEAKLRKKRNELRQALLDERIYVYEGILHSYSEGKDKVYKGNVNGMVEVSKEEAPYLYKTVEFSCDYAISKDGNTDIMTKLLNCFFEPDKTLDGKSWYEESLYDYNEETNAIPWPHNVLILYEENVYQLKDEKLSKVKLGEKQSGTTYFDLFNDPLKNQAMLLQDSVQKKNEKTYSVQFNGTYELSVEADGDPKKVLMTMVDGYKILSDGRIIVVAMDEKTNKKGLYCIDINETITIVDIDVVNLLGEGTWNRTS